MREEELNEIEKEKVSGGSNEEQTYDNCCDGCGEKIMSGATVHFSELDDQIFCLDCSLKVKNLLKGTTPLTGKHF